MPLYGPEAGKNRSRYEALLRGMPDFDCDGDVRVFTAPGRTELCGNHTDHNRGKVIAAAIQLDIAAVVVPRTDKKVFFRSAGFPDTAVDLGSLAAQPEEKGTTAALVRGVAAGFERRGVSVSGWTANAASTIPAGLGLSSSAAIEALFGKIFGCFSGGGMGALEIAKIGQNAENVYFGKPSGLMDQAVCASGGAVAIDFCDAENPVVRRVSFDPLSCGYALVIVNTRGSHVDLTPDYAAIPAEMRSVAGVFGRETLAATTLEEILGNIPKIRAECGDRALLRAIHFHNENKRVETMRGLMVKLNSEHAPLARQAYFQEYLSVVNDSGRSSWELLQNMYPPANAKTQALSAGIAVTREFLKEDGAYGRLSGACRVHGGGFAGAVQAYIPVERTGEYRALMDGVFGPDAVTILKIRPAGATEVVF